jgi:hypothetical protein
MVQTASIFWAIDEGKVMTVLNYIIKHYAMNAYEEVEVQLYHS